VPGLASANQGFVPSPPHKGEGEGRLGGGEEQEQAIQLHSAINFSQGGEKKKKNLEGTMTRPPYHQRKTKRKKKVGPPCFISPDAQKKT